MKEDKKVYEGPERRDHSWHLDKRLNISIIFAILAQTGTAFFWVGSIEERISSMESFVTMPSDEIMQRDFILQTQIIANKESLNDIRGRLQSIDNKLDRLIERNIAP